MANIKIVFLINDHFHFMPFEGLFIERSPEYASNLHDTFFLLTEPAKIASLPFWELSKAFHHLSRHFEDVILSKVQQILRIKLVMKELWKINLPSPHSNLIHHFNFLLSKKKFQKMRKISSNWNNFRPYTPSPFNASYFIRVIDLRLCCFCLSTWLK